MSYSWDSWRPSDDNDWTNRDSESRYSGFTDKQRAYIEIGCTAAGAIVCGGAGVLLGAGLEGILVGSLAGGGAGLFGGWLFAGS